MKQHLELDSLYLEFGGHKVLQDVYMSCHTGEVTGLLGRNGSGKSSLMKIVSGFMPAYMSSVRIDGKHVKPGIRNRFISYLPQQHMLPDVLTPRSAFRLFNLDEENFLSYFPGQEQNLCTRAGQLAGGDKRLTEIYCVLGAATPFAILDEPFSCLSPIRNEQVITLIKDMGSRKGIIITDHAYRYVLDICNKSYVLLNGKTWPVRQKEDLLRYGYLHPED